MSVTDLLREPLGPEFSVSDGLPDGEGVSSGWVVRHKPTGLWIWTGGILTLHEARERLLLAAMRR